MKHRILIIQGHPDPAGGHFGHALAGAYAIGATAAGHEVRRVSVATLDFPLLQRQADWNTGPVPAGLRSTQADIAWADHLAIFFPLWLGTMPARLKGFFEQVLRPGFAFIEGEGRAARKGLTGKSARVVVTMGMPVFWYRWYFGAHGVRGLERSVLAFCGVDPIRETFIGLVGMKDEEVRERWIARLEDLGRKGG
jgi:putative NADPH-quinone reductase